MTSVGIKCFIASAMVVMAISSVSASDTITDFKTGPFVGSVDLGMSCDNITVIPPSRGELKNGSEVTFYGASLCGSGVIFEKFENSSIEFDIKDKEKLPSYLAIDIKNTLLKEGADKDTINISSVTINDNAGAIGSGYISEIITGSIWLNSLFLLHQLQGSISQK